MIRKRTEIRSPLLSGIAILASLALGACGGAGRDSSTGAAQSCMTCHNGSTANDYSGPGLPNPHPFPGAEMLLCTNCHGGDPNGRDKDSSHVPPPPQIGDRAYQQQNAQAWFNRLTLAGIDKYPDYTVNGVTWRALDYLQFVNPGDLRVVTQGRSCGQCHGNHAQSIAGSPLATETGIIGGALYAHGESNRVPSNQGLYGDTASDYAFRTVTDPDWFLGREWGTVPTLVEQPVYSRFGVRAANQIFQNPAYDAAAVNDDVDAQGRLVPDSPLSHLYQEQVSFTCGDCHLGSAGANNRYADFRSSGCTPCHMPYSLDGRSRSGDPNVDRTEPIDPDDIDPPERSHIRAHRIQSVRRTLSNGVQVDGIDDYSCVDCHQGSNRMVLQYWGIRLDQNQDVRRGFQYPANPVSFTPTFNDRRLFDPAVGNNTFNGRNGFQYLLEEDYDGDGRDDTPPDIHYEKGLGCIDCHGSYDIHGDLANPRIVSRMEQAVAIRCEDCHGTASTYAATVTGTDYAGQTRELLRDSKGTPLKHVVREANGDYWLTSRVTGNRHYVPQTRDAVVDTGKRHPVTNALLYSTKASYAMGRADSDPSNGIGPHQTNRPSAGFSHADNMSCASCHSAWTNTCAGCHLKGDYNTGNNFSNITGERIVYRETNADFTYQHVIPFNLGVGMNNKIEQFATNTKVFYQWRDRNGNFSRIFSFSDRRGQGANPSIPFPSLGHNFELQHSIRGKVTAGDEGPRYCVACHLTTEGLTNYGAIYNTFRTQMANNDFGNLDFNMLATHIGRNPSNQLNSPIFVHMVAGLGSGVFLFNADGGPVNPLDANANRFGSNGVAPRDTFSAALVRYNLDRIVLPSGVSTASNNHMLANWPVTPNLRDGATDPEYAGPLGASLVQRLTDPTTGIVLDSWLDANGAIRGNAGNWVR
jgi:hypothetical protein